MTTDAERICELERELVVLRAERALLATAIVALTARLDDILHVEPAA